ncbi:MAG: aryl-sulfate sulfotransferase, partial [Candidatus Aminicenantes bacterium]|nr:aryl-sulfate sulfotransferase [Candidatus Aminicenantes bacterium]
AYYVGSLNFNCIFKIDRSTGDTLWRLGGEESDFTMTTGDENWFYSQHQFQVLDDGLLVFNNGPYAETETRASEYELDLEQFTIGLRWEYQPDPPLGIYAFGDVWRLPTGNTLITWSSAGQIDEVTPEGELVWRLNAELGAGFGYVVWTDDLYSVP